MKKLLAIFLCLGEPAWATWTLVQHPVTTSGSSTSCSVTVSAIGAGHLVIYQLFSGSANAITSITATGETFVNGNVFKNTSGGGTVDSWYTLSAVGGETTIQGNYSTSTNPACRVMDYSYTQGPISLDDHQTKTATTSTGITPVLTGSNDVILQCTACVGTCSGVATYGNYSAIAGSDGSADLENTTSTTAPVWTGGASGDADNELAFKEAVASTSSGQAILGSGLISGGRF